MPLFNFRQPEPLNTGVNSLVDSRQEFDEDFQLSTEQEELRLETI